MNRSRHGAGAIKHPPEDDGCALREYGGIVGNKDRQRRECSIPRGKSGLAFETARAAYVVTGLAKPVGESVELIES
jgi:hypothetical protein